MAHPVLRTPARAFPHSAKIQYTVGSFFSGNNGMALGTWDPNIETASNELLLDAALLNRLIGYDREDTLPQLEQLLSDEDKQRLAGLMKIDHDSWRIAAESLTDADLIHLIRFFAVAENIPGWEAGADSPVIPLAKMLRQRGARLEKPLLHWLRDVNENRYLPYGPL
jgi:hypothetical protein